MVTREDVYKIAKLAKLYVNEDEIDKLTKDIAQIISFADKIKEYAVDEKIEFDEINNTMNAFHEDTIAASYSRSEILKNRDGGKNDFFIVKKMSDQR